MDVLDNDLVCVVLAYEWGYLPVKWIPSEIRKELIKEPLPYKSISV